MITGWVLLVVLTNGMSQSTVTVFPNFLSETECKQVAAQSVASKDRFICFKGK